mgnify:CR=1 FL=1
MTAYLIATFTVRDAERMDAYAAAAAPTLAAHGGEFVFEGHRAETLFGTWSTPGFALVRFPDMLSARAWYNSADYKALAGLRASAADMDIALFDAA